MKEGVPKLYYSSVEAAKFVVIRTGKNPKPHPVSVRHFNRLAQGLGFLLPITSRSMKGCTNYYRYTMEDIKTIQQRAKDQQRLKAGRQA